MYVCMNAEKKTSLNENQDSSWLKNYIFEIYSRLCKYYYWVIKRVLLFL